MVQEVQKKIEEKNRVLKSATKLFDARDDIIDLLEKGTFPYKGNVFKTKEKEESEETKLEIIKDDYKFFLKYIEFESRNTDYNLFEDYFNFSVLVLWQKNYLRQKIKKKTISW